MKELSLDELKAIELDILKMFHAFCIENNIRYFLGYGTLLGAIRYKKFIPWDDDVDVLVPREDYDRLMSIFRDSEKYRLLSYERTPKYHYPFAKLCDLSTHLEEEIYTEYTVDLGVGIDIFPLDHWENDFEQAKLEAKSIFGDMARLGYARLKKPLTDNPLKFAAWSLIIAACKMRGCTHYVRKIIQKSSRPEQKGSAYVGAKVWPIYGERGIIPAEAFADTIEIEFEGEKFPAPAGYDTYLTCLYGDYLPEPPVEKRKTHHSFRAYRA